MVSESPSLLIENGVGIRDLIVSHALEYAYSTTTAYAISQQFFH
jgi:hypothetical protein